MPTQLKNQKLELVMPSTIDQVVKVEKFLQKIKRLTKMDEEHFYKLLVATTEAVNNGIIHGNKRDPAKTVILRCDISPEALIISVQDEGPGFDNEHLPDPLAEENLMRDHGRGVFLIRSLMDSVRFQKLEGGSEVIMTLGMG